MARVSFSLRRAQGGSHLRSDVNRTVTDGAMTINDFTLTSATANFHEERDVGASVVVTGAGSGSTNLVTTIDSVTSSTEVELVDMAGETVSGATVSIQADDVDGLRAGGVLTAPAEAVEAFLEVNNICYGHESPESCELCTGQVVVSWEIPTVAVADLGADPEVCGFILTYSTTGAPETVDDGTILMDYTRPTSSDVVPDSVTHGGLHEGRWVYYSLFANYRDQFTTDGGWYERVASIAEIIPKDYASTLSLYNRIPWHYRNLDEAQGDIPSSTACYGTLPVGGKIGPLYKYLSIIGFEMDRIKTLVDHNMVALDPVLTGPETLEALAGHLGTSLSSADLGTSRLRSLLDNIGTFRRTKGTERGTEFFLEAVTGRSASIDDDTDEITLYSQRVNHILDPQNTGTYGSIETEVLTGPADLFSSLSLDKAYTLDSPVNVVPGDVLNFSINSGVGVVDNVVWARLLDTVTGEEVGRSTAPTLRSGIPVFEMVNDGSVDYYATLDGVDDHIETDSPVKITPVDAYVSFDGVDDTLYVSDEAAFGITGDIAGVVHFSPHSTGGQIQLLSQSGQTSLVSHEFAVDGSGVLSLTWTENGDPDPILGTLRVENSGSSIAGYAADTPFWVGYTLDVDNGASGYDVKFWDGGTGASPSWSQLGTTDTGLATTSLFDNFIPLTIGGPYGGLTEYADIDLYDVALYDGIGANTAPDQGTKVFEISQSDINSDNFYEDTSFDVATGQTVIFDGPSFEGFMGDLEIILRVKATDWSPASDTALIASDEDWYLYINSAGELVLSWNDGTSNLSGSVTHGFTDGLNYWVRAILDVDDGGGNYVLTFYDGGTGAAPSWSVIGAPITVAGPTKIQNSNSGATVGVQLDNGGTPITGYLDGDVYEAEILDTDAVFSLDRTDLAALRTSPSTTNYLGQLLTKVGTPTITSTPFTGTVDVQYGVLDSTTLDRSLYLLELNSQGPYFDGDVVRGGWLVDTGIGGGSIGDYRWQGTQHNSRSLYASQYSRTNGYVDSVLDAVLPINEASKFSIVTYDGVPGVD